MGTCKDDGDLCAAPDKCKTLTVAKEILSRYYDKVFSNGISEHFGTGDTEKQWNLH